MTDEDGNHALAKAMAEFQNWGIVFWNTEDVGGYIQLKEYAMMSNTDADTALMAVDAIATILIEKKSNDMVKTCA